VPEREVHLLRAVRQAAVHLMLFGSARCEWK
jgi:hypothetical protein